MRRRRGNPPPPTTGPALSEPRADSSVGVALAANSLADAVAATWTSVVRLNPEPGSAAGLQTAVANHGEARRAADRLDELLRRVDRSPG
jgi:hypothetical protein